MATKLSTVNEATIMGLAYLGTAALEYLIYSLLFCIILWIIIKKFDSHKLVKVCIIKYL